MDHTNVAKIFDKPNEALTSFAIDDAITTTVGEKTSLPTIRLWQHPTTVVLGIPDTRIPFLEDALEFIQSQSAQAVVRNSGGLAVLLDQGVLNMSMIIPNDRMIDIHDGYKMMLRFIQDLFKKETHQIEAYEIVGSYCPGDYDLSINGIKFAGISQRRIRNGVAVQIYLDIEGNSHSRASLIKEFYKIGIQGQPTNFEYPHVIPEKMGTLRELTHSHFTVETIKARIQTMLTEQTQAFDLTSEEEAIFAKRYDQMIKRNEKI